MMKSEFEALAGVTVEQWQYEIIETVYTYRQEIKDKQQIADIYNTFGMAFIKDLLPRAEAIKAKEWEIHLANASLEKLKNELQELREGGLPNA